jgi:hypothetical protein
MRKQHCIIVLLFAATYAAACGGGSSSPTPTGPTSPPAPSASLTGLLIRAPSTPEVGGTTQLAAEAMYSDGSHHDVTSQTTWASESTGIATITSGGLLTGIAYGKVTIKATYQTMTSTGTLTVRGPMVDVKISAIAIDCLGSCESALEGPGEFAYHVDAVGTVGDAQTLTRQLISETSGYANGKTISLNRGGSYNVQGFTRFHIRNEAGALVDVTFRATEWDKSLLPPFNTFKDPHMNDAKRIARFLWNATTGWNTGSGTQQITLGSGACKLRLRYRVEVSDIQ